MSIAPVLPPEIAARPADPVAGAVVIPFRHRAPEPPPETEPRPEEDPAPDAPPAHPVAARRRARSAGRATDPPPRRAAGRATGAIPGPRRSTVARGGDRASCAPATMIGAAVGAAGRRSSARGVRADRTFRAPVATARDAVRPGARVVRPAASSGGLRLTRRGRVVVAVAALLGALGVGMLSARVVQSQASVPDSAPAVVQVQPGDTLWSIAQRVAPQADTRAVVDTIIARNNIVDGVVHSGQRLVIRP